MAQSLLEGEGIHAIVEDSIVDRVLPWMPSSQMGAWLQVDESEFEQAAQVLADWDASTPLEESEEPEGDGADEEEPE